MHITSKFLLLLYISPVLMHSEKVSFLEPALIGSGTNEGCSLSVRKFMFVVSVGATGHACKHGSGRSHERSNQGNVVYEQGT